MILHSGAKSYCFAAVCVPKSMFNFSFTSDAMNKKNKLKVWLTRAFKLDSFNLNTNSDTSKNACELMGE